MSLVSLESYPVDDQGGETLMKRFTVVAGSATLLVLVSSAGQAGTQIASRLQEVDPQARTAWEVTVPVDPGNPRPRYTVLADRVAVLARDGRTIHFHGLDGRSLREFSSKQRLGGINASPNGALLLAVSNLSEDEHFHQVLAPDGRLLWSATLGSPLRFSPSGNFLITDYDASDASQPPTVLAAETGKIVWQDEANPPYWDLAAAEDDTLAYYQPGRLTLVDLTSGRQRWQQAVPADPKHDVGRVRISLNGQTVVVETRVDVGTNDKPETRVTRVYDRGGRLSWERRAQPVAGQTNGGVVAAVSEDGAWLAVDDLDSFALLRASDGAATTRIPERHMCCVTAFTREVVVLDLGAKTRFLRLAPSGTLLADTTLDESLRFLRRFTPHSPGVSGPPGRYVSLLVRLTAGMLTVTELDFQPGRAAAPEEDR